MSLLDHAELLRWIRAMNFTLLSLDIIVHIVTARTWDIITWEDGKATMTDKKRSHNFLSSTTKPYTWTLGSMIRRKTQHSSTENRAAYDKIKQNNDTSVLVHRHSCESTEWQWNERNHCRWWISDGLNLHGLDCANGRHRTFTPFEAWKTGSQSRL